VLHNVMFGTEQIKTSTVINSWLGVYTENCDGAVRGGRGEGGVAARRM
jgi:hypothetical protein